MTVAEAASDVPLAGRGGDLLVDLMMERVLSRREILKA